MVNRLSRRALGLAAVGTAAWAQTASDEKSYNGMLDGVEGKIDAEMLDAVLWTRKLYDTAALRLTFRAQNRQQAEAWQKRLRAKIVELLGGFPASKIPLAPQTLEVREYPTYRREKFVFMSRPGSLVAGYLLTPSAAKPPHSVVICVPGHGRGVDDIVGIDAKGRDRTDKDGYQHDFALQAVEQGLAAVAIELMAFGCRRDPITKKKGLTTSACQPTAGAALLLGQTMISWRVYDVMRAIDWIETRNELNPRRVGCMGISGGGTCTVFSTALEPRIKAAMVSGYLNTFRDSIFSLSHCMDNYVPGILNWCEMYDVAGLIAPRPLFAESGERDAIFPIEASRSSFERVTKIYQTFEAGDALGQEIFPGTHSFHGVRGLPFLAKHLLA